MQVPVTQKKSLEECWQNYKKSQMQWMNIFYQNRGIDKQTISGLLKKLQSRFDQLEQNIRRSHFADKYYALFYDQRKKNYILLQGMCQSVGGQSITSYYEEDLKKPQLDRLAINYKRLKYENHKRMIRKLSSEKYRYKQIPQHVFIQEKDGTFHFEMEKGYESSQTIEKKKQNKSSFSSSQIQIWDDTDPLIMLILLRDLAFSIIELEKNKIFHADIAPHNILLFGCGHIDPKGKQNPKIFLDKIKFKLIDYGDAFVIGDKGKISTDLIKLVQKVLLIKKVDPSYQEFNGDQLFNFCCVEKFKSPKDFQSKIEEEYKKNHSQSFRAIIQPIINGQKLVGQKYSEDMKETLKQIREEVINYNYQKAIKKLNDKIRQLTQLKGGSTYINQRLNSKLLKQNKIEQEK